MLELLFVCCSCGVGGCNGAPVKLAIGVGDGAGTLCCLSNADAAMLLLVDWDRSDGGGGRRSEGVVVPDVGRVSSDCGGGTLSIAFIEGGLASA